MRVCREVSVFSLDPSFCAAHTGDPMPESCVFCFAPNAAPGLSLACTCRNGTQSCVGLVVAVALCGLKAALT
jgi:hypothetical protein